LQHFLILTNKKKKFEITLLNKKKQNCSKGTTKFQPLKFTQKSGNEIPAFGFT